MTNLSIVKSFHGEGLEKIELILFTYLGIFYLLHFIYIQTSETRDLDSGLGVMSSKQLI